MCPSSSGILAELLGKFLANLTHSELPPLSTELATDLTSLSGLSGSLGVVVIPPVHCAQFELFFLLPAATVVAVQGAAVLLIAWASR